MAVWIVRPGGRLVRFRNKRVRHRCSRRKKGRPAVGTGCYRSNPARRLRRHLEAQLRRQLTRGVDFVDVTLAVPHGGYDW